METQKVEISVVAPMHNESGNTMMLYNAIKSTMDMTKRPYEIIFVNDASTDDTLSILNQIKADDDNFHVCDLEYNAGENWALQAGISMAKGEIIVTIDGDFQNDPVFIPDLLAKLEKGCLVASGWRLKRKGSYLKRVLPSRIANRLISLVSGVNVHDCGCGLKAYRRDVVVGKYVPNGFMNRFSPVVFGIKNEQFKEVIVEDRERSYGKSHYGLERIFIVFNDLLALPFILQGINKSKPMIIFSIVLSSLLLILSVTAGIITMKVLYFCIAGFCLFVLLGFLSIRWNLKRFSIAKSNPGFKIRTYA